MKMFFLFLNLLIFTKTFANCDGYLKENCTDCEMKLKDCIAKSGNVMNTDTKGKKELIEEVQKGKNPSTPNGARKLSNPTPKTGSK